MTTVPTRDRRQHASHLADQTVVVLGGSGGIGLAVARQARTEGAEVIVTARSAEGLAEVSRELEPRATAAFDATDHVALRQFFDSLDTPVDHVMVTAGGSYYGTLSEIDFAQARRIFEEKLWLAYAVAQHAPAHMRAGGTLIFMSGTGARTPAVGMSVSAASIGAMTALTADLALELAPIRVNLLATGFLDTPLSAALLGDGLAARMEQLRAELPIGRLVELSDVAALAVHLMSNTALTGTVFDIDGGEKLMPPVGGRPPEWYSRLAPSASAQPR